MFSLIIFLRLFYLQCWINPIIRWGRGAKQFTFLNISMMYFVEVFGPKRISIIYFENFKLQKRTDSARVNKRTCQTFWDNRFLWKITRYCHARKKIKLCSFHIPNYFSWFLPHAIYKTMCKCFFCLVCLNQYNILIKNESVERGNIFNEASGVNTGHWFYLGVNKWR